MTNTIITERLKAAVGALQRAQEALAVEQDAEELAAGLREGPHCPLEDYRQTPCEKALEDVDLLRRRMTQALDVLEVIHDGADDILEVLLAHRVQEDQATERVEDRCADEELRRKELRQSAGEIRNALNKARLRRKNHPPPPVSAYRDLLFQQIAKFKGKLEVFRMDTEVITQQLATTKAQNRELDSEIRELSEKHRGYLAQSACARLLMAGEVNFLTFRRSKEVLRNAADSTLQRGQETHKAHMAWYRDRVLQKEESFRIGVEGLEAELQELRLKLLADRKHAEQMLIHQASEHLAALKDVETNMDSELALLEEERQHRVTSLHREVVQTRERWQDALEVSRQTLETHIKETRIKCQRQLESDQATAQSALQAEVQAVSDAKRERLEWKRKADRIKENYQAHAANSRTLVKSLEGPRKQELVAILGQ